MLRSLLAQHCCLNERVARLTSMLVLLIVGPKCTLAASMLSLASYGEYADGTDKQTDGRTSDRYITPSARYGQRNKGLHLPDIS